MLEELGEYENQFNYITGWPLYFLVTFYYLLACLQVPGSPVSTWVSTTQNLARPFEGRYCGGCNRSKPDRAYHCGRCGVCVVKRDHHCDFTNQCVGVGNYKSFFWFTTVTMVGSLHPALRSVQWFYHYYQQDLETVQHTSTPWLVGQFLLMNTYWSMFWFTLTLTKDSFRNSFTNCTRLDLLSDMESPPLCCGEFKDPMNNYDMGLCRNWVSDFGWNPLLWFVPMALNDYLGTYTAHRFAEWPTLSPLELTYFSGKPMERIQPNSTRIRAAAVAEEYRLRRSKEEAQNRPNEP